VCVGGAVKGQGTQPGSEAEGMEGDEDTLMPIPLPERVPYRYAEVRRVKALDDMAMLRRVKEGLEGLG
jgi:hypothetical protein